MNFGQIARPVQPPNLIFYKAIATNQAPVTHAHNPSYLGGRDQEDHGLKPTQA
jgi:hypothetical protein